MDKCWQVGGGALDILRIWQLKLCHAFTLSNQGTLPGVEYVEGLRIQVAHHLSNKTAQCPQPDGGEKRNAAQHDSVDLDIRNMSFPCFLQCLFNIWNDDNCVFPC